jgi:hypothetical protein
MSEKIPTVHIPVGPPPTPIVMRAIAVILAIIAAILGFTGHGFYAGIAAAGSAVFGIAEILRSRGVVEISKSDYLGQPKDAKGKTQR